MLPRVRNLLSTPPANDSGSEESFHPLLENEGFSLEQIVSRGQASGEGAWYDQDRDEWVLLLCGTASLAFAESPDGKCETLDLVAGDAVLLPARRLHRVTSTSDDARWLALHFDTSSDWQR